VVAYLRAALEGDRLIREDPESIAGQYQKWTGIEAEVFYAFHGPQGIQTRDYTLKPEVIEALGNAAQTLKVLKKTAHDIDISTFVDDLPMCVPRAVDLPWHRIQGERVLLSRGKKFLRATKPSASSEA
jgi:hypothetical protein